MKPTKCHSVTNLDGERSLAQVDEEHLELAARFDTLVLVHTPHLEDKRKGTRLILDAIRNQGRLKPGRVLIDHVEEHTVRSVLDVGCGTGASGAGWALACAQPPKMTGVDRHPWAVTEARRTWTDLGLSGTARIEDFTRVHGPSAARRASQHGTGVLLAHMQQREFTVSGLDYSRDMLDAAARRCPPPPLIPRATRSRSGACGAARTTAVPA